MTVEYCLGRAVNGTDHSKPAAKVLTVHESWSYKRNESLIIQEGDGITPGGNSFPNNEEISTNLTINNSEHISTNISKNSSLRTVEPNSELPLPIIIASPVAALSIVILICIAYKWHAVQLDEQAKELALEKAADHCNNTCDPCSPCRATHRLVPPGQTRAECDLSGTRRKSLRTPTPPPSISRSRASLWSADQEVLTHVHASPRRHSTFILWYYVLFCEFWLCYSVNWYLSFAQMH